MKKYFQRKFVLSAPIFLAIFALVVQSGCSTASVRVLPGDNGVHRVAVRDIQKHNAEEEAVEAAQEYCEKRHAEAVFLEEKETKYTGKMDEGTRDTVRKASTAAMILSPGLGVGTGSGIAGGALGSAGMIGYSMTSGKDYQSELKFKCKKAAN